MFTIYFDISCFDLLFHILSEVWSFQLHAFENQRTLDFGIKLITWCLLSPREGQQNQLPRSTLATEATLSNVDTHTHTNKIEQKTTAIFLLLVGFDLVLGF